MYIFDIRLWGWFIDKLASIKGQEKATNANFGGRKYGHVWTWNQHKNGLIAQIRRGNRLFILTRDR